MIVVDASAMIEVLVGGDTDPALLDELTGDIAAPHVLDLAPETADRALQEYFQLNIQRHSTALLAGRIWHLRYQFTAYDASYLALAEALGVPLITCDKKLAPPGHRAEVRLFPL